MIADEFKTEKTIVTFLLDRSGSMEQLRDDTIGAFNTYLDTLKEKGKGIEFSLVQFDTTSVDKVHVGVAIKDVERLTRDTFIPRAGTPLIDAAWKTIKAVEAAIAERSDHPKVVICIQTDGQENSSCEHSFKELAALIADKTLRGWQFNFMGVGIDAYEQGAQMGISTQNTVSYGADAESTRQAFTASASNTASYSSGLRGSTAYTMGQKKMSGDPTAQGPLAGGIPQMQKKVVEDFNL